MPNFNNLESLLKGVCEKVGEQMLEEAKERVEIPSEARNPQQFVQYRDSLKTRTEMQGNNIVTKVYSDLVVSDGSKWDGVPIGAFLEWGTGPMGDSSNGYPHGYPYTIDKPWDEHSAIQYVETGTWGITARPHLYPTLQHFKPKFKNMIMEEFKKQWKN